MNKFSRRRFLRGVIPIPFLMTIPNSKSSASIETKKSKLLDAPEDKPVRIIPHQAPSIITNSVKDILREGNASLRKHFGAVGDGDTDDTKAFEDWWGCLIDLSHDRMSASTDEIPFMLQKGPLLNIESGVFIYSGKGLGFTNSSSLVLNVSGESPLSTKIIINNDSYLFDMDKNPVYTYLCNLTVHGGSGLVRFKSKDRATTGIHLFKNLRASRYRVCAISNNSIDMPYFRVDSCIFYGDISGSAIGVCVSGYSAGGYISNCIFSDNLYGVKLAVTDDGHNINGPATPYNIVQNDFYRTGSLGKKNSYDIWIEPGRTSNNAGRGIIFSRNKFGQEFLYKQDCHVLIADSAFSVGSNLNGDRHHSVTESKGFVSGLRFESNNVNSNFNGYTAPFIKTYSPNVGNNYFCDIYDNGMPDNIVYFSNSIKNSELNNLSRSNYFDAGQCLPLQKGDVPRLLSNRDDVFKVHDPLGYYCGHPQVPSNYGVYPKLNFSWLYNEPTEKLVCIDSTRASVDNSYGGRNEASIISTKSTKSRVYTVINHQQPSLTHWIDFELKRYELNTASIVSLEITDVMGEVIHLRRNILLSLVPRWQRVVLSFVPSNSSPYKIILRVHGGKKKTFVVGNFNVYVNEGPINTGHNEGERMTWNLQHEVHGNIHEWYDSEGFKRAKVGTPEHDKDGVVISLNKIISNFKSV
ncbi:TPA: hypothetical protein ACTXAM_000249 [Raoultella ornithinolytica]|uniref:hypothetical protein n=1 Tax=Raoultella ornithinolytica TaxID=54291 RepID=UPI0004D6F32C|nr:hypothetical protein [Raoultella ornithinolytica]KDV93009.1 hypothetical protein AB00_3173 [Raoultella ornithinolytica 2-156-04_S1_C1]KDX13252.1 hypothetical protein AB28_3179 [Raoultella ornithinolytica 2-156-04_S1_C2]